MKSEEFLGKSTWFEALCHAVMALGVMVMLASCLFAAMKFASGAMQAGKAANRTGHLIVGVESETTPSAAVAADRSSANQSTAALMRPVAGSQ